MSVVDGPTSAPRHGSCPIQTAFSYVFVDDVCLSYLSGCMAVPVSAACRRLLDHEFLHPSFVFVTVEDRFAHLPHQSAER